MSYTLTHGIHRGTITSRDVAAPESFETELEAMTRLRQLERNYQRLGYVIWFAEVERPDGTQVLLRSDSNYMR